MDRIPDGFVAHSHGPHGPADLARYPLAAVFAVDGFGDELGERGQLFGGTFQRRLRGERVYRQYRYEHERAEEHHRNAHESGHGHEQRLHPGLGGRMVFRLGRFRVCHSRRRSHLIAVLHLLQRLVVQRVKEIIISGNHAVWWSLRRVTCKTTRFVDIFIIYIFCPVI